MKKLTAIFFIAIIISGCNPIDTYYIISEESIQKGTDGISDSSFKKNRELLYTSMRIRLKIESYDNFRVKVMITHDFSELNTDAKKVDPNNIWSSSLIRELNACDFFNESNWNCGESNEYKNIYIMSNGELSIGELKLIKKYGIKQ